MSDIQNIALNKLRLSEANVRKNDSQLFIAELAENIAVKGIIQNLVAAPAKKRGFFDVMIGGRRLRALALLAETGRIAKDYPVLCRVLEGEAAEASEQTELSLTENFHRLGMTPTDEIRAFKHFINQGSDLDAIAKRFGQTRRFIEGRLRLADLAAPIFAALDEGSITLDVAKAYASTPSTERQIMVWEQLQDSWQAGNADTIRRMITHAAIPSNAAVALLVTEPDYLAAGGRIESDLFQAEGGDKWLDSEIAMRLAGEKLQTYAAKVAEDTGYAWVRPVLATRLDYTATEALHRVHLEHAPLSEEEQLEADTLREQMAALEEECESASEEDSEALNDRWEALEAALARIEGKPAVIPEDLRTSVGCFVLLDTEGNPVTDPTLFSEKPVRRAGRAVDPTGTGGSASPGGGGDDEDGDEFGNKAAAPKPLSQKLVDELAVQRRDILSLGLSMNPAVALDYMIFVIADNSMVYGEQRYGTTLKAPSPTTNVAAYPVSPASTEFAELRETLDQSWTEHDTTVERFKAFTALDDDAKAGWLAYSVAKSLEPSLGVPRFSGQVGAERILLHDHLAVLLALDPAAHWRPTSANYFDRVNKQTLLRHINDVGGSTMAASYMSAKKGDLSQTCQKLFAGDTIVAPEVKAAALAWVPPHMRFNGQPPSEDDIGEDGDDEGLAPSEDETGDEPAPVEPEADEGASDREAELTEA